MKTRGRTLLAAAAGIAAAVASGCASVPPPKAELAVSEAAVAKAQEARAYEFAPLQFNAAQEKLMNAKLAMEREEYETARQLAEQAEVDANLAYYSARNALAQRSAAELQQSIETLRKELQPGS
jgi:hypothetical protein